MYRVFHIKNKPNEHLFKSYEPPCIQNTITFPTKANFHGKFGRND